MLSLLRDLLLSFCPLRARLRHRPASPATVLHAATWLGLLQFLLFAAALLHRYARFFSLRAHQWVSQMKGTTEVLQTGAALVITLEFLLYPLSLLLLYLALEGLARFAAGLVASEVVPSLPVAACFRLLEYRARRRQQTYAASLPRDSCEPLPEGGLRISSALSKPRWTDTVTISIHGRWYAVERQERAAPPRSFVYVLRPAPVGHVLRRLEEYEPGCAPSVEND